MVQAVGFSEGENSGMPSRIALFGLPDFWTT